MRVIVVEDEPLIAYDLISEIEADGHEVIGQCRSAKEVVILAEALRPDLIVMDIGLVGDETGLDAARKIRQNLGIGCIFISATLDRVTPDEWHGIDPIARIQKPYRDQDLRRAMTDPKLNNGADAA